MQSIVIGVDGRSGAGKTSLVNALISQIQATGRTVSVFRLDEIYPGWDGLAEGVRSYAEQVLPALAAGQPATYRRWDWFATDVGPEGGPGELTTVIPADVVLCEGVGAASNKARHYLDLTVWVQASPNLRHQRALERDGAAYLGHWDQWAAQEEALFSADSQRNGEGSGGSPAEAADVVVEIS